MVILNFHFVLTATVHVPNQLVRLRQEMVKHEDPASPFPTNATQMDYAVNVNFRRIARA